jgi:hypothetical protein
MPTRSIEVAMPTIGPAPTVARRAIEGPPVASIAAWRRPRRAAGPRDRGPTTVPSVERDEQAPWRWRYLRSLIRHDLTQGFRQNALKYVLVAAVFIFLCVVAQDWSHTDQGQRLPLTWPNYALFLIQGVPAVGRVAELPILWLLPQVLIALLVVSYPTEDLSGYATQVLYRVGGRGPWWAAKWVWLVATVTAFYAVAALVATAFAAAAGGLTLTPNPASAAVLNTIDSTAIPLSSLYALFAVALVTSIALSTAQMVLAVILRPIAAFLLITAYLVLSGVVTGPWLIGDYAMALRNHLVDPRGLNTATMCLIGAGVTVVVAVLGGWFFRRLDLLGR